MKKQDIRNIEKTKPLSGVGNEPQGQIIIDGGEHIEKTKPLSGVGNLDNGTAFTSSLSNRENQTPFRGRKLAKNVEENMNKTHRENQTPFRGRKPVFGSHSNIVLVK